MIRFTLIWSNEAQDQLAQIWLDAPDRKSINDAANRIDALLQYDPHTKGEPVTEGLRSLDAPPLRVLYSVAESDRLVQVVLVRHTSPSTPSVDGNGQVKH